MIGSQIGFNPQAGIPQVPQGKPTPQRTQTGTVQPSIGPMSSMDKPPMTPNQMMTPMPMSQRIAGLQDRMELATPIQGPQATEDAFAIDKIIAGFGGISGVTSPSPIDKVNNVMQGQPLPSSGGQPEMGQDIKQAIGELGATILANPNSSVEETKAKFPEFANVDTQVFGELGATIKANPNITIEEVMQKFPELSISQNEQSKLGKAIGSITDVIPGGNTVTDALLGPQSRLIKPVSEGIGGFVEGMSDSFKKRKENIDTAREQAYFNPKVSPLEAVADNFVQAVGGTVVDVLGEGFMAGLSTLDNISGNAGSRALSAIADTEIGRQGMAVLGEGVEAWNRYEEENPVAARRIKSALIPIEIAAEFVGAGTAKRGVSGAAKQTSKLFDELPFNRIDLPPSARSVNTTMNTVKQLGEDITYMDKAIGTFTKLDPQTVRTIKNDKGLILLGDAQGRDPENTTEYILDAVQNKKDMFSEAGPAYNAIRDSNARVRTETIRETVENTLMKEGITIDNGNIMFPSTTQFTPSDQNLIKQAVEPFLKVEGDISPAEFLNMRSRISKEAGFDMNVTKSKEARDFIKRVRGQLNESVRDQIPGLKEADSVYQNIIEGLDDLERIFITRAGDEKSNLVSKARSVLNRSDRDKQKQALLRAIPDIEDRIKYLDVLADINRSAGPKVGTYLSAMIGVAGFGMGNLPLGIAGTALSIYLSGGKQMKKLLTRGGVAEEAAERIAKKVSKQQELLESERKTIQDAIMKANMAEDGTPMLPQGLGTPERPIEAGFTPLDNLPRTSDLKVSQPSVMVKAPDIIKKIKGDIKVMPDNSIEVKYIRNKQKSRNMGDTFLQSTEPKGQYFNISEGGYVPEGRESGTKTFKKPLLIERKNSGKGGWKEDLSNMYGGKKGEELTNAIKKDGYDGIVTYNTVRGEMFANESVDLSIRK